MSVVGTTASGVLITQELINSYAVVSGDYNPLHIDPEFAESTPFGRTIAHGHLLIGVIGASLSARWPGRWASNGRIRVKFIAPVYVGDTVEVHLGGTQSGTDGTESVDVAVRVGERVCVVGTGRIEGVVEHG